TEFGAELHLAVTRILVTRSDWQSKQARVSAIQNSYSSTRRALLSQKMRQEHSSRRQREAKVASYATHWGSGSWNATTQSAWNSPPVTASRSQPIPRSKKAAGRKKAASGSTYRTYRAKCSWNGYRVCTNP